MSIQLHQISKRYAGLAVVDQVSLDIADGELFVLLGTSGSGKSTLLRIIAGLSQPDQGRIILHGRDVTQLPPQARGTGFVFQNYSIFRHMSVSENIEFGLKLRRVPSAVRVQKCKELLDLVGMSGLGRRYADQLSGGQQQRVALARALAYEPDVLLLDEPFGALDLKTRAQLRRNLREVQRKLGVTTILVTHDQDEAFDLADRIGVLSRGKLLETGEPESLYRKPKTVFAATFLGAGTVLVGRAKGECAYFGPLVLPIPPDSVHEEGTPVRVLIRPEQVLLSTTEPEAGITLLGRGTVIEENFSGSTRRLRLKLPRLPATRQISPSVPFGEESMFVEAVIGAEAPFAARELWVALRGWHILEQPSPKLLVFHDGRESNPALLLARRVSEIMQSSVALLTVSRDPSQIESERKRVFEVQTKHGFRDLEFRARAGEAAEQILSEQAETAYSMLLITPHPVRSLVRGIEPLERIHRRRRNRLGPVLIKVLSRSRTPVMVVRKERAEMKRVLICTAVGEPGKSDVRVGGRIARNLGAAVTLLHVSVQQNEPGPLITDHLERAAATLRSLDLPVTTSVRKEKSAAQGILAACREGSHDMIVIGKHQSRSMFGRDDVMLKVLVSAECPVLVVPADEE
jgi:sulfate transport system ATP-binding protein